MYADYLKIYKYQYIKKIPIDSYDSMLQERRKKYWSSKNFIEDFLISSKQRFFVLIPKCVSLFRLFNSSNIIVPFFMKFYSTLFAYHCIQLLEDLSKKHSTVYYDIKSLKIYRFSVLKTLVYFHLFSHIDVSKGIISF